MYIVIMKHHEFVKNKIDSQQSGAYFIRNPVLIDGPAIMLQ